MRQGSSGLEVGFSVDFTQPSAQPSLLCEVFNMLCLLLTALPSSARMQLHSEHCTRNFECTNNYTTKMCIVVNSM